MRSGHGGPLSPSARGPSSSVLAPRVASRSLAARRERRALLVLLRNRPMDRLLPRVRADLRRPPPRLDCRDPPCLSVAESLGRIARPARTSAPRRPPVHCFVLLTYDARHYRCCGGCPPPLSTFN